MYKMLSAALVAFAISCTSVSAEELESLGLKVAEENTYSLCKVLEVTAVFRDSPSSDPETDRKKICVGAFQVSATEIITSEHVTISAKDALMVRFAIEEMRFGAYGITFTRSIPQGDMGVAFYYELVSSEGAVLRSPIVRFSAPWGNQDPTPATVLALAKYLETVEVVTDSSEATVQLAAAELHTDLALFRLNIPWERDLYIEVASVEYQTNEEVWGFAIHPPDLYSRGLPLVMVNHGVISATHKKPEVEGAMLDPALWVYQVLTDRMNPGGVSGNAVVDGSGRLVGVTLSSSQLEQEMVTEIQPSCNTPLWNGNVFICSRAVIPTHVVHDFLARHRAQ